MKGRSKLYRTESRRLDRNSAPASSHESVSKWHPKKRQRSDSSYSERDSAEVEIQDLRSQLAKERQRRQELEAMAERAEHHSEMASTISQLMRAFK
eukprot:5675625-Amphidinium_carterae.1